jgi:hypothetical protein
MPYAADDRYDEAIQCHDCGLWLDNAQAFHDHYCNRYFNDDNESNIIDNDL